MSSGEDDCIICFYPTTEASSACCQQPIHYNCIDRWFHTQLQTKSFSDITCPYCRTRINSVNFDIMVSNYKNAMESKPFYEDRVFMRAAKAAWGDRPLWRGNDGYFYGEMWNVTSNTSDVIFLGCNKEQTLARMRAITNYLVTHYHANIWSDLCRSRYVSQE